jgi:hypothetical protein
MADGIADQVIGPAPGSRTIDEIPWPSFVLRLFWVAVRIVLVVYLGQAGALFFYQGF